MYYLLVLYILGFGLLSVGFLNLSDDEKDGAETIPTLLAYTLWPISLVTILSRFPHSDSRRGQDD